MMKVDFKKTLKSYQAKANKFEIIEVPKLQYLMIDGHGDPNTSKEFSNSIEALYPLAYKLKFLSRAMQKDYVVPPLEGLWWASDMETFTSRRDKSAWDFTLMLMVPGWISEDMFLKAKQQVAAKGKSSNLDQVRLESLDEDLCVQTLFVGAYDDEEPVLEQMHSKFIPENNLKMAKKHHEIYLSDFRKVAPSKLRTILRQPVEKL